MLAPAPGVARIPSMHPQDYNEAAEVEQQPLLMNNPGVAGKSVPIEIRQGFVRKVYSILTCQLLMTSIISIGMQSMDTVWVKSHMYIMYLAIVMAFATVCLMGCCGVTAKRCPINYILLFAFTAFEGILIGFVSAAFTWQSVGLATGITFVVFVAMSFYAFHTDHDFTGLGPYVYALSFCIVAVGMLIGVLTIALVEFSYLTLLYDCVGVVLFTFFVIFDTQLILGEWGGHRNQFSVDEYAYAALTLYLDILNFSLFFVQLLGERRK
mmetsp:Transcript_54171/g.154521  ORF Transcript_54171/g.154521 Transcript_54171/m.154521 type:complete len:267 (-) Transcript_54171:63-863(-)